MKVLFIDFSTKLKSVKDLDTIARGGMVSSLFKVPDELSKMELDVWVLSDIEKEGITPAGTKWINSNAPDCDVLVLNRGLGNGYPDIKAKKRILWTHDLPHSGFAPNPKVFKAFDRVVFMSSYAEKIWRAFYRDIGRSVFIPNGVDKNLFKPIDKNMSKLIYISAPNRGLKRLPLIFDSISYRLNGEISMDCYSNMAKLHPNEVGEADQYELDYAECKRAGLNMYDPIPQSELAIKLGQAALMILPSGYPEICSNSILQSLACGTPVVTTGALGATCEWVRDGWNGRLTKFQPHDYMIHTIEMVRGAIDILSNTKLHGKMIKNAINTPNLFTWKEIGTKWHKMIMGLF